MISVESFFWVSFILIFHTYLGYPAVLLVLAFFKSQGQKANNGRLPFVSMLIAAHNEEEVIAAKIKNCGALEYPEDKLEIIIGSDGSTDRTNAIIAEQASPRIQLMDFTERRGKASVLNRIAPRARGEVLIFSDANTMYREDALRRLVSHFSEARVGGVCGRLVLLNPNGKLQAEGERFYWSYENFLKNLEGKIRTVIGANGAIYAIRKELFRALPNDTVVMDDFLIPLGVVERGYDMVYDKEAVSFEFTAPDLKSEFKRKVRIGAANFHGLREIFPLLHPAKGFIAFALWSHKIIRWLVPFLLIILFIANVMLLHKPLYQILFAGQILFYLTALLAYLLEKFRIHLPLLIYPYYFVVVNSALLLGFFKFLTKSQRPAWVRVER